MRHNREIYESNNLTHKKLYIYDSRFVCVTFPAKDVIDAYMTGCEADQVDDEFGDEDSQTQQDYETFKSWLDKQDKEPPAPAEDAPKPVEKPARSKDTPGVKKLCKLCQGDATTCHLTRFVNQSFWFVCSLALAFN